MSEWTVIVRVESPSGARCHMPIQQQAKSAARAEANVEALLEDEIWCDEQGIWYGEVERARAGWMWDENGEAI